MFSCLRMAASIPTIKPMMTIVIIIGTAPIITARSGTKRAVTLAMMGYKVVLMSALTVPTSATKLSNDANASLTRIASGFCVLSLVVMVKHPYDILSLDRMAASIPTIKPMIAIVIMMGTAPTMSARSGMKSCTI